MYENRIDFNTVRQYGKDNVFPACRAVFCETRDGSSFHFQFPEEDDEEDEDAAAFSLSRIICCSVTRIATTIFSYSRL